LIDLSLQIEILVEFGSMTVVVVEDDEVDALGEQLSRCVFWVFLLIYSTKVFSISKRIDENVSILIWVKGCYLYMFRCLVVSVQLARATKNDYSASK